MLRPGGLVVYTARTTADAHCGTGTSRGDDIVEYGGFIVHFFDQSLVDRLALPASNSSLPNLVSSVFKAYMTLAAVFWYPTLHFEHHRPQLTHGVHE